MRIANLNIKSCGVCPLLGPNVSRTNTDELKNSKDSPNPEPNTAFFICEIINGIAENDTVAN